ncbi:MAG: DUF3365 domain-containing protein [Arenicellales bacterium]|nr:DUF3365 domain-containing protein [Arenicellales bacterium]
MNLKLAKRCSLFIFVALTAQSASSQEELTERTQAAGQTVMAFAKELGGALKAELGKGDPSKAIGVCRDIAPSVANRLSLQSGWKISRVGTRVRNPMIGTPDAWEQQVLIDFKSRAAQGQSYKEMSHSEVVEEPGGRYFRFMKPIPVQEVCLACHGNIDDLAETVRNALTEHYPHDQAVNYKLGDLRGAFSIKQPLE